MFLFYKRINDPWKLEFQKTYKELLAGGYSPEETRKLAKEGTSTNSKYRRNTYGMR